MSYKRRQARKIAAQHEYYETPDGNAEAYSNETDSLGYEPQYPGPRETRYLDASNVLVRLPTVTSSVRDNVDWSEGGIEGMSKFVGSSGVTDPQTVDRHDFAGEMAVVRRMPDTNYGPVGTADHNSILSLLYQMQESNAYFPNEVSQADMIRAV